MIIDDARPTISIRVADWCHDRDTLSHIRQKVFIKEQRVPADMEWDEFDETSTHYLVTQDDLSVATARLKPDGQIGRMAVLPEFRNKGIGNELLKFVLIDADNQNIKKIYLHAQVKAISFYERQGFVTDGEVFYEAGIPHQVMRLTI